QDGVFANAVLHGHHGRRRHQGQHQADAGVAEVAGEADQLFQVAHRVGLKDSFGTGVGLNLAAAKGVVDSVSHAVRVGVFGQRHLELRDRADRVEAGRALEKLQVRVEEV